MFIHLSGNEYRLHSAKKHSLIFRDDCRTFIKKIWILQRWILQCRKENISKYLLASQPATVTTHLIISFPLFFSQINSRDAAGRTPLHLACERGDLVCVKELLEESQARTDIKDRSGETPMHCAAKQDSPAVIQVRRPGNLNLLTGSIIENSLSLTFTFSRPPDPVFAALSRDERPQWQRGDGPSYSLPYGPHGGCQSPVGRRGQVWRHWKHWVSDPQCHEVQWERVSWTQTHDRIPTLIPDETF